MEFESSNTEGRYFPERGMPLTRVAKVERVEDADRVCTLLCVYMCDRVCVVCCVYIYTCVIVCENGLFWRVSRITIFVSV